MKEVNMWTETLLTMMTTLWGKVAGFIPSFFGALLICILGLFVAKSLSFIVSRILKKVGFDRLSDQSGIANTLSNSGIKMAMTDIAGTIIYWMVLLTFLVSATETLGLPKVSETLDQFIVYLPKVIGAVLILVVGLFFSRFVKDAIRASAQTVGKDYALPLSNAVYGLLFIIVFSLAISELEIETQLLNTVVSIIMAAIAVAVALSLGLGTREISANIVSSVYARDMFKPGDYVAFDQYKGTVVMIGATKVIIEKDCGTKISIPNSEFINKIVKILHNPENE